MTEPLSTPSPEPSKSAEADNAAALRASDVRTTGEDASPSFAPADRDEKIRKAVEALNIALGHLTGGMDGDWRDCDPRDFIRNALTELTGGEKS